MQFQCSQCQSSIEFEGQTPPTQLSCPSCGASFALAIGETATLIGKDPDETAIYVRTSPEPTADSNGDRLGDYEFVKEVGRGGMGVVYQAMQLSLNRTVALKTIRSGELANTEDVKRFYAEAEAAARLDHPHIVPVYEVGEHDGRHFFSMGFVEGESLADSISDGPLPPRQAAELVRTIAEAVAYAHGQGIVHRDLKPRNILIDPNGQPRITDFGLAKRINADSELTATGQVMGTPSYMPPEQAVGDSGDAGPHSDIYSLGAVLYCLLTGRPPFQAASVMETLRQVLEQEPVPPRQLDAGIDRDLETICLKCLEKEPSGRYATASELAAELSRFLEGRPINARPISRPARIWRWCRRNRMATALIASLFVGTGVALYFARDSRIQAMAAINQRNRADANSELYQSKAVESRKNAELYRDAANHAVQKTSEAIANARVAKEASSAERKTRHIAQMGLAFEAWKDGNIPVLEELLNAQIPKGAETDLRSWDWYYLKSHTSDDNLTISAHEGIVTAIAWDPTFTRVVSSGADGFIRCWDLETGHKTYEVQAHQHGVYEFSLHVGSSRLATIGRDDFLRVWDMGADECRMSLEIRRGDRRNDGDRKIAWSPDGDYLATVGSSLDSRREVLDGYDGKPVLTLPADQIQTHSVAWSLDGKQLLYGGTTGPYVRGAATGKKIRDFRFPNPKFMRTSSALRAWWIGNRVAATTYEGTLIVWNPSSDKIASTLNGHNGPVIAIAIDRKNGEVITAGSDHTVRVWDMVLRRAKRVLRGHRSPVMSLALTTDGKHIVSGDRHGAIKVWRRGSNQTVKKIANFRSESMAWSPDSQNLAVVSPDSLSVWSIESLSNNTYRRVSDSFASPLDWSHNSQLVATNTAIIDTKSPREIVRLERPKKARPLPFQETVRWAPDSTLIAGICGFDGQLWLWNPNSGKIHNKYGSGFSTLAWHPNSSHISLGGRDGKVHILEVASVSPKRILDSDDNSVITAIEWHPSEDRLVTGSESGVIRLWDVDTQSILSQRIAHSDEVSSVVWHPDGRRLATSSGRIHRKVSFGFSPHSPDYTIRLWDAETLRGVLHLSGPRTGTIELRWSPDGRRLAACGKSYIYVWDAKSKPPIFTPPQVK